MTPIPKQSLLLALVNCAPGVPVIRTRVEVIAEMVSTKTVKEFTMFKASFRSVPVPVVTKSGPVLVPKWPTICSGLKNVPYLCRNG